MTSKDLSSKTTENSRLIRHTSIEVYHQIESEGLLSALRFDVYKTLFHHGPLTQMELCRKISNPIRQDRSYMPRFAELKKMGVIKEVGEKVCSITGRNVLLWDVTDKLPIKLEKPERTICSHCKGKGFIESQQARLL